MTTASYWDLGAAWLDLDLLADPKTAADLLPRVPHTAAAMTRGCAAARPRIVLRRYVRSLTSQRVASHCSRRWCLTVTVSRFVALNLTSRTMNGGEMKRLRNFGARLNRGNNESSRSDSVQYVREGDSNLRTKQHCHTNHGGGEEIRFLSSDCRGSCEKAFEVTICNNCVVEKSIL